MEERKMCFSCFLNRGSAFSFDMILTNNVVGPASDCGKKQKNKEEELGGMRISGVCVRGTGWEISFID